MADSTNSNHFSSFLKLALSLFALTLTLTPKPVSSSSLRSPAPNFDPNIALYGDAELAAAGSRVDLTRPTVPSSGLLLLCRPFRLLDPKLPNPTSFTSEFTFSVSPGNADGIALVLVPGDFASKFSGESSLGVSEPNTFLVVAVVNASSPVNEEKLRSWIDYDSSSKRLEVRLAKSNESRPYNPIIAYAIDFPAMWRDREVLVGISSSNVDANSPLISTIYSWNFRLRNFPNSIHSLPADPRARYEHSKPSSDHRKRVSPLAILAGLIFATVCGALMAFSVLFLWAVVANRHAPFAAEHSRHQCAGFRYEKIGVVVEKDNDIVKI